MSSVRANRSAAAAAAAASIDLTGGPPLRERKKGGGGKRVCVASIDLTEEGRGESSRVCGPRKQRRTRLRTRREARAALKELRTSISLFLQEKASLFVVEGVEENEHSLPGSPLAEAWLAAYTASDKSARLVFHGTAEKNLGAICERSLDPAFRRRQLYGSGEYFGGDAASSLAYCSRKTHSVKMLVFGILTDPSGLAAHAHRGIAGRELLVVNRAEHQLPMAVVTLTPKRTLRFADGTVLASRAPTKG